MRPAPRSLAGLLAVLALTMAGAPGAVATTPEEQVRAVELAIAGRAAAADGRYVDAVKAFEAAYALDPAPALIWLRASAEAGEAARLRDAAQLEEARGWFTRAAESYAELRRLPSVPAELADQVASAPRREAWLRAEVRAIDAELARRVAEAEAARRAEEAAREAAERERLARLVEPEPEPDPGPGLPWPEIVTIGAGTVVLGVGTWLLVDAESTRADVRDAETEGDVVIGYTQTQVDALEREADGRATWGVVAMVVGGAAVATGVTLLLLDDPPEVEAKTILGGAPLPGGGMVTVTGGF